MNTDLGGFMSFNFVLNLLVRLVYAYYYSQKQNTLYFSKAM
jgi:hypothetical protein